MTAHYLMTRAVYSPHLWPDDANQRRLQLFTGITVAGLAAQTTQQFVWVLAVHADDPFIDARLDAARAAGVDVRDVIVTDHARSRAAAAIAGYQAAWSDAIDDDGRRLMTRLDDDDTFAPDALERVQAAAAGHRHRCALVMPVGYRVWGGMYSRVRHLSNAMQTLLAPAGDLRHVYSYRHREVRDHARLVLLDDTPGWLWTRHDDTLSGHKAATKPVSAALRRMFPIDWSVIPTSPLVEPKVGEVSFQ